MILDDTGTLAFLFLTMKSINLSYGKVNFTLSENAIADTLRARVPYESIPRRAFDAYQINNAPVLVNRRRPSQENGWHGYNDIQISIAKYLFGGTNYLLEFNDYHVKKYRKEYTSMFAGMQADISIHSGIGFNIFAAPVSRYHVALNLQCSSRADAERLRDYWFETVTLRYLPVKRQKENTRYWNCKSYDGTGKPNQCFAIYPTGNNKLRLEYRRNNMASMRGIFSTKFAERLTLENSFKCLTQPKTMNAIFWQTARHFFTIEDQEKIFGTFPAYSE
ncbi:MAG TPA: hypothetical protein VGC97_08700 [Pyrinomonadaceae bacterium]|jgi:hypothetical protein